MRWMQQFPEAGKSHPFLHFLRQPRLWQRLHAGLAVAGEEVGGVGRSRRGAREVREAARHAAVLDPHGLAGHEEARAGFVEVPAAAAVAALPQGVEALRAFPAVTAGLDCVRGCSGAVRLVGGLVHGLAPASMAAGCGWQWGCCAGPGSCVSNGGQVRVHTERCGRVRSVCGHTYRPCISPRLMMHALPSPW